MRTEKELTEMAKRMRIKSLKLAFASGKLGAHLGGALSCIEILAVLYGAVARIDSSRPEWEDRDRILMGKAHCVLAYDAALYEMGFLTEEELNSFQKNGSFLVGHPQKDIKKGMEYAGGSLGMALSVGAGMALLAKKQGSRRRIYVLLGDGECNEGSVWESMMFAAKYKLDNLVVIVDKNHLQSDGATLEISGTENLGEKITAFGWNVTSVDGHNTGELLKSFQSLASDRPNAIIADTIKGKGVSFMEQEASWHHGELKEELYLKAIAEVESEGTKICRK